MTKQAEEEARKISEKEKKKEKKKIKKKQEEDSCVKEVLEKHKDDPLFSEFIGSHIGKDKHVWGNDTGLLDTDDKQEQASSESEDEGSVVSEVEDQEAETKSEKAKDNKVSDLEYLESLKKKDGKSKDDESEKVATPQHGSTKFFTVKIRGLGYNHKKKHIKQFFHPVKAKSIRVPQKIKGIAYVGFKTERLMKQALDKNKSFLDGKRIFVMKYDELDKDNSSGKEAAPVKVKWKDQEEALKNEESIAESGRIFIRNLSYTTNEDEVRKLFEKYGPLTEVNLPIDRVTRKLKGFGTVTFLMPEHAIKAHAELDGSVLNGRMLHILPGKTKPSAEELMEDGNLTFKEKKDLKAKASAGSSHNWNTLFLGQNAVVDSIATAYNTTKENVLNDAGKGSSVAVRLALGETQLVLDTKKFLEENGVRLDAFNQVLILDYFY